MSIAKALERTDVLEELQQRAKALRNSRKLPTDLHESLSKAIDSLTEFNNNVLKEPTQENYKNLLKAITAVKAQEAPVQRMLDAGPHFESTVSNYLEDVEKRLMEWAPDLTAVSLSADDAKQTGRPEQCPPGSQRRQGARLTLVHQETSREDETP